MEGFTDPEQGRLCVCDIKQRRWFPSSPRAVAAARGYYDYSEGSSPDATADEAFDEFETSFPNVRRELVASKFTDWVKHCDFLVRYSQMLRARSDLFREEALKEANRTTFLQIEKILEARPSLTRPGETEYLAKYSDCEVQKEPQLLKNMSITQMRAEIAKGAGEFAAWHWCLRFTEDVTMPVITGDNSVGLMGSGPFSRDEAMKHPDTLFVFPLCWQACLIGSPRKFDTETETIHPNLLAELHRLYLNEAGCRFAYSPKRLG